MEEWKELIGKRALELGILKDPQWLLQLDEKVPLWVILEIALHVIDTIGSSYSSYD
ncbi:hypothetical protein [Paenibacillus sp. KN14-4R]|uniref:hypothetical protein n=1 Tax=Paenibacillus sp. KN14-4R TaxID=3445773 RepID=UPI003F9F1A2A